MKIKSEMINKNLHHMFNIHKLLRTLEKLEPTMSSKIQKIKVQQEIYSITL